MILPIVAYGTPVLKKKALAIPDDYEGLSTLIENMWETMYSASGVGLAAPQVGLGLRLFVIDASPFAEDEELSKEEQTVLADMKKVFINAQIEEEVGDEWAFTEGCLSIPDVREDVKRKEQLTISYTDETGKKQIETFSGLAARVIQHEYDHIEGVLFTDKLSPLKKRMLKGKLTNISKGKVNADYKMKFPFLSKKR